MNAKRSMSGQCPHSHQRETVYEVVTMTKGLQATCVVCSYDLARICDTRSEPSMCPSFCGEGCMARCFDSSYLAALLKAR